MTTKLLKRREFLSGIAQATIALMMLGRTSQLVAKTVNKPSVIILGAGLSGLYAAMLLEAQGFKVTAIKFPGMEGALKSGERAATEILNRI